MLESSIRLATVAGIRIGVHYTWFIVFALISFSLYTVFRVDHPEWGTNAAWFTAIVTALLFFASIVLHELGHSIVAISRGIRVRSITLFIFGGMAQTERDADSAATEFLVAIAGPLVSFVLAAAFYAVHVLFGSYNTALAEATDWLATINFVVALFNLVPGFPLDGGRVLRAAVWGLSGNAAKGMQWAVMSGRVVAFGLMGWGVLVVLRTGFLLNGLWLMAIGWFLLSAAEASGRNFAMRNTFTRVRVRDVMQPDVPWVEADTSITEWLDEQVLTSGRRAYLVRDGRDVVGLVTLTDCRKVARERWTQTPVQEVMTPAQGLHCVSVSAGIDDVLRLMQDHSLNQVPVTDRGEVIGWVDRERLVRILQLHAETGR